MSGVAGALPSISLLVLLGLTWLEYRLLGGRATLSPLRFLIAFSFGLAAASVLAVGFALVFNGRLPLSTVAYSWGPPIEELAKALPVLALAFLFLDGRRLSLVDLCLVGLASGLGFEFVESNLHLLATSSAEVVPGLQEEAKQLLPGLAGPQPGLVSVYAGHGITTALVGLAAGVGVKLWPRRYLAFLPALLVLAWVTFDHLFYNWEAVQSNLNSSTKAQPVFEQLHNLTLQGRLETFVLPLALLLFAYLEGRRTLRLAGPHPELLLPGEPGPPRVLPEWLLGWSRLPLGLAAVRSVLAYFRHRRTYLLTLAEASPASQAASGDQLNREAKRLLDELERVKEPNGAGWVPRGPLAFPIRLFTSAVPALLILALFALVFLFSNRLPSSVRSMLFGRGLALTFVIWPRISGLPHLRPDQAASPC